MISPDISRTGFDAYQLTWWCNTDNASEWAKAKIKDGVTFDYNRGYVKRINAINFLKE
jgi:hypothetical protein